MVHLYFCNALLLLYVYIIYNCSAVLAIKLFHIFFFLLLFNLSLVNGRAHGRNPGYCKQFSYIS